MSQNETILNHLQSYGSITSLEAIREYGVTRLSARIHDLRNEGHNIYDERIDVPTRHGTTTKVKRYRLVKPGQMEFELS